MLLVKLLMIFANTILVTADDEDVRYIDLLPEKEKSDIIDKITRRLYEEEDSQVENNDNKQLQRGMSDLVKEGDIKKKIENKRDDNSRTNQNAQKAIDNKKNMTKFRSEDDFFIEDTVEDSFEIYEGTGTTTPNNDYSIEVEVIKDNNQSTSATAQKEEKHDKELATTEKSKIKDYNNEPVKVVYDDITTQREEKHDQEPTTTKKRKIKNNYPENISMKVVYDDSTTQKEEKLDKESTSSEKTYEISTVLPSNSESTSNSEVTGTSELTTDAITTRESDFSTFVPETTSGPLTIKQYTNSNNSDETDPQTTTSSDYFLSTSTNSKEETNVFETRTTNTNETNFLGSVPAKEKKDLMAKIARRIIDEVKGTNNKNFSNEQTDIQNQFVDDLLKEEQENRKSLLSDIITEPNHTNLDAFEVQSKGTIDVSDNVKTTSKNPTNNTKLDVIKETIKKDIVKSYKTVTNDTKLDFVASKSENTLESINVDTVNTNEESTIAKTNTENRSDAEVSNNDIIFSENAGKKIDGTDDINDDISNTLPPHKNVNSTQLEVPLDDTRPLEKESDKNIEPKVVTKSFDNKYTIDFETLEGDIEKNKITADTGLSTTKAETTTTKHILQSEIKSEIKNISGSKSLNNITAKDSEFSWFTSVSMGSNIAKSTAKPQSYTSFMAGVDTNITTTTEEIVKDRIDTAGVAIKVTAIPVKIAKDKVNKENFNMTNTPKEKYKTIKDAGDVVTHMTGLTEEIVKAETEFTTSKYDTDHSNEANSLDITVAIPLEPIKQISQAPSEKNESILINNETTTEEEVKARTEFITGKYDTDLSEEAMQSSGVKIILVGSEENVTALHDRQKNLKADTENPKDIAIIPDDNNFTGKVYETEKSTTTQLTSVKKYEYEGTTIPIPVLTTPDPIGLPITLYEVKQNKKCAGGNDVETNENQVIDVFEILPGEDPFSIVGKHVPADLSPLQAKHPSKPKPSRVRLMDVNDQDLKDLKVLSKAKILKESKTPKKERSRKNIVTHEVEIKTDRNNAKSFKGVRLSLLPRPRKDLVTKKGEKENSVPDIDQPNFVPVYNYAPINAYYNPVNRNGPNDDGNGGTVYDDEGKDNLDTGLKLLDEKSGDKKRTELRTVDEKEPTEEQPNYVPVYNYVPANAYYNPLNRYGPNSPGLENREIVYDNVKNLDMNWKPPVKRIDEKDRTLRTIDEKNIKYPVNSKDHELSRNFYLKSHNENQSVDLVTQQLKAFFGGQLEVNSSEVRENFKQDNTKNIHNNNGGAVKINKYIQDGTKPGRKVTDDSKGLSRLLKLLRTTLDEPKVRQIKSPNIKKEGLKEVKRSSSPNKVRSKNMFLLQQLLQSTPQKDNKKQKRVKIYKLNDKNKDHALRFGNEPDYNPSDFLILTGNPAIIDEGDTNENVKSDLRSLLKHVNEDDAREEVYSDIKKPILRDRPTAKYEYYNGDSDGMKTLITETVNLVLNFTDTKHIYPILYKLYTNYFMKSRGVPDDKIKVLNRKKYIVTDDASSVSNLVDISKKIPIGNIQKQVKTNKIRKNINDVTKSKNSITIDKKNLPMLLELLRRKLKVKNNQIKLTDKNVHKILNSKNMAKQSLVISKPKKEPNQLPSDFLILTGNPSILEAGTHTKDVKTDLRNLMKHVEPDDYKEELDAYDDIKKRSLRDKPTAEYDHYSDPTDISSSDADIIKTLNTAIQLVLNLTDTDPHIYPILQSLQQLYTKYNMTRSTSRKLPHIDSKIEPYVQVLQDKIKIDANNRALNEYDWLATTVDIRSGIQKLVDLSQRLQCGTYIHPRDLQMIKFVLFLYGQSEDLIEPSSELFARSKKHKYNVKNPHRRPLRQPSKPRRSKVIKERPWLARPTDTRLMHDFELFWSEVDDLLIDLHDAIKHISVVTTFKKQKWFQNLMELYLSDKTRKQALEVLLHLIVANVFSLIEAGTDNGMGDNYVKYAMNYQDDVKKITDEFDFLVKVFNALRKQIAD